MAKKTIHCVSLLLLAMALPVAAQTADAGGAVAKQASTASAHAGMALGATDLKMAQTHLHHVVNCLVGPSGKGFDVGAGNPCDGMGHGGIVDAKGDAATESRLQAALAQARQGLEATTLDGAHADAQKAMTTLQAK